MKRIAHNKTSNNQLQQWCTKYKIDFLDKEYINNAYRHAWYCKKHKQTHHSRFDKIKQTNKLKCCNIEKKYLEKMKLVRKCCRKYNITLMGPYKDSQTPVKWKCNIHNEISITTRHAIEHTRGKLTCCRKGKGHTLEQVIEFAKRKNLRFLDDHYLGTHHKHRWLCLKHNVVNTTKYCILKGGSLPRCCSTELRSGENHPNFNKNISDQQRIQDRRSGINKNWRQQVLAKNNFCCECCTKNIKQTKLVAHHLESYMANPTLRYDINNGITLCINCHKLFHRQFGMGNNTADQFNSFLKTNKNYKNDCY